MLRAIFTSFLLSFNLGFCLLPTQAQVISDRTLDSRVDRVDEEHLVITGGKEAGQNLFHSFSEFSVPSKSTVHFDNNVNIENIFSRVTGGSISDINGVIKANGNASLFLLNPAGIIFGPNAQLELGGSFIATTAETIVFPNGIEFSAANTETEALLTVNIPIGLQYGKSPGAIISHGVIVPNGEHTKQLPRLSINPSNTIALVGGEVLLRSTRLETDAARTEIGSVSDLEFVTLQPNSNGWTMNYDSVNEFGKVELSARSGIESGNGGNIQIRGQEIVVRNSLIDNVTSKEVDSGNTNLIATDLIEIDDSFILTQVGVEDIDRSPPIITSQGGNIFLQGQRINFANGAVVFSGTTSLGSGGNVTIYAQESVRVFGKNDITASFISTSTLGDGAGGKIDINTGNLFLQDGGQIRAESETGGEAGTINVNAKGAIEIAGTEVVPIFVENSTLVIGEEILKSGFFATTESGTGGEIYLTAKSILLGERGTISATVQNNGDGGNINIATETLVLFPQSKISADVQEGRGGNIQINTKGLVVASEVDEQITASSERGIDGEVNINTPDVNSKIDDTTVLDRSPLAIENLIYTGCSLAEDYISSQFNYIGRGGLPFNPLETIITEEIMVDLGSAEISAKTNKIEWFSPSLKPKPQEIREVTNWIVNHKGYIELIVSSPKAVSTPACQFNSSR